MLKQKLLVFIIGIFGFFFYSCSNNLKPNYNEYPSSSNYIVYIKYRVYLFNPEKQYIYELKDINKNGEINGENIVRKIRLEERGHFSVLIRNENIYLLYHRSGFIYKVEYKNGNINVKRIDKYE